MKSNQLAIAVLTACSAVACANAAPDDTGGSESGVIADLPKPQTGCIAKENNAFMRVTFTRSDRVQLQSYDSQGRPFNGPTEYSVRRNNDGSLELYSGPTGGAVAGWLKQAGSEYALTLTQLGNATLPATCNLEDPKKFPSLPTAGGFAPTKTVGANYVFSESLKNTSCKASGPSQKGANVQVDLSAPDADLHGSAYGYARVWTRDATGVGSDVIAWIAVRREDGQTLDLSGDSEQAEGGQIRVARTSKGYEIVYAPVGSAADTLGGQAIPLNCQ